jgi:hypothetical protein
LPVLLFGPSSRKSLSDNRQNRHGYVGFLARLATSKLQLPRALARCPANSGLFDPLRLISYIPNVDLALRRRNISAFIDVFHR